LDKQDLETIMVWSPGSGVRKTWRPIRKTALRQQCGKTWKQCRCCGTEDRALRVHLWP